MRLPRPLLPSIALLLAAPAPSAAPLPAAPARQDAPSATAPPATAEVERWSEWPDLSGSEKADVRKDVSRLRKASTYEMGRQAHDALVERGGAVIPFLLPKLAKEDDSEARERMLAVLHEVSSPEHTRLLAEELDDREEAVRVWAMRRIARFPDAGLRERALEVHGELVEREGEGRRAPSAEELRAAALLAVSTGATDGLERLYAVAREEWKEEKDLLLAALAGVRGPEASRLVLDALGDGDRKDRLAALRLLWACGDESAVPRVAAHLDSQEADVRKAAINALRCIVDGDEPLERLSVFEGIERAKAWKERL